MNDNSVISIKGVSKSFRVPHERNTSLKQSVINTFASKRYTTLQSVDSINLDVKKGEFLGIVGRNGCGKSTLLKMIAGIYMPSKGTINTQGRMAPFIELGVGFNNELTGRENVFLSGTILGLTRSQIEDKYQDIVSFAELEEFMDQKLKNYSSGMQVRLAFSIAIQAKSDILLIDEVLAVGDAAFQQKCFETFYEIKDEGRTVVFVTHDMSAVTRFCDRAVLIEKGKVIEQGDPLEISNSYLKMNYAAKEEKHPEPRTGGSLSYVFHQPEINGAKGRNNNLKSGDQINFSAKVINKTNKPIHIGFQIFNSDRVYVFGTNTKICGEKIINAEKFHISIALETLLNEGKYYVTLAVLDSTATNIQYFEPKIVSFTIKKDSEVQGVYKIPHKWKVNIE